MLEIGIPIVLMCRKPDRLIGRAQQTRQGLFGRGSYGSRKSHQSCLPKRNILETVFQAFAIWPKDKVTPYPPDRQTQFFQVSLSRAWSRMEAGDAEPKEPEVGMYQSRGRVMDFTCSMCGFLPSSSFQKSPIHFRAFPTSSNGGPGQFGLVAP